MVRIVSRTAVIQRYGQITHKQLSTPESFNYKFVYLVITDLLNFLKSNLVFLKKDGHKRESFCFFLFFPHQFRYEELIAANCRGWGY